MSGHLVSWHACFIVAFAYEILKSRLDAREREILSVYNALFKSNWLMECVLIISDKMADSDVKWTKT